MSAKKPPTHQKKPTLNGEPTAEREPQKLTGVLQQIVQNAGALLHVHNCSIALLDEDDGMLVTRATLQKKDQTTQVTRNTRFNPNEGVAGWVAEHRQPLVINDVSLDPRFKRLGRSPIGSILCVPLFEENDFIGTLTATSTAVEAFDPTKLQLLTIFAQQAVLAITSSRHAELAQRQAQQLELLLGLSQNITAPLDTRELYHTILLDLQRLVYCQQAVMYTYDREMQRLLPVAELLNIGSTDLEERNRPERRAFVLTGEDVQRETVGLYDESSVVAWAGMHRHPMIQAPHAENELAEIATPLVSKDVLYGAILLQRREAFGSDELRLVRNLCNLVATALENAALFQTVRLDSEQLHAILEASSDGIALVNLSGYIFEVNPAFGRLFGIEPQQLQGLEYREIFDAYDLTSHEASTNLEKIYQAIRLRQMLPNIEIDYQLQNVQHSIGLSVTPVDNESRPFCLLIARDVTAIRDATRIKANFLSMITHELRSPLNAINGYLDLTLAGIGGELNEQQREFVQRARAGSEHLFALVEDLLFISRADSGQVRLSRDVMNLHEIISNAVEELELQALDHKVEIEIIIPEGFPPVYADAVRIQQVLRNLISNALNFTSEGGRVTIACAVVDEPLDPKGQSVDLTAEASGREESMVQVSVNDTGCGIASEYLPRIFERFYQSPQNAANGQTGGQGLGLAIVKMIVELHGGHVTVDSLPNQGSTFTFTLPYLLI